MLPDTRKSVESAIHKHLSQRLCSRQWQDALSALAAELANDLTPNHLRAVMRRTGERFARQRALPGTPSLEGLQTAINAIWADLDWGWVEIGESGDHLALTHWCAPLRAGFGADSLGWTTGFLEGAYEQWMRQLGADAQLRVSQAGPPDEYGTVAYRFGK